MYKTFYLRKMSNDNYDPEFKIIGVRSLQFPHQLVEPHLSDWSTFLSFCDNYSYKTYNAQWIDGMAEELLITYWQWTKNHIIKTMTTHVNRELIGILFLDEQPIFSVQGYDIIHLSDDHFILADRFVYLLELFYQMNTLPSSHWFEFLKLLLHERRISQSPTELSKSNQSFSLISKKTTLDKKSLNLWTDYLEFTGTHPEEFKDSDFIVLEWQWQHHKITDKIIDIYAWPKDNQTGAIFMDNQIIFLNNDGILAPQNDFLDRKFYQLKSLEPVFSTIRLSVDI